MLLSHSERKPGRSTNCKPGSEKSVGLGGIQSPVNKKNISLKSSRIVRYDSRMFEGCAGVNRRGK